MRESNLGEAELISAYSNSAQTSPVVNAFGHQYANVVPFFSMRKLRLVFNELSNAADFEFSNFDSFKKHVLSSSAPHLELSKWQAIASRR
ncbi:hypothetical protein PN836_002470 [Ningiella sp. W23]|uniref:hypothetical protein n=1 Tax=Ningiella sp. W23 TaxID=3023715 RepID=UPI003756613A